MRTENNKTGIKQDNKADKKQINKRVGDLG